MTNDKSIVRLTPTVSCEQIWPASDSPAWFNPCAVRLQDCVLLLVQTITGSDVFGGIHESRSTDNGQSWSTPQPVPSLGRIDHGDGLQEGLVCPVPDYHAATNTVLAMGTNVWYQDERLTSPRSNRHIVYAIRDANGTWSAPQRLKWDDPRASGVYSCCCHQRYTYDNGDVLVPVMYVPDGESSFRATTLRCSYDGTTLEVISVGSELRHPVGRGMLEPSITRFGIRFFLTLRAEDGHGYYSTSEDGLDWSPVTEWTWADGSSVPMSSTQQHWLINSRGIYLVYTRQTDSNSGVPRWRAPLFVAQVQVDNDQLSLIRETEQVLLPLIGDGSATPSRVAYFGNFQVISMSADESWVTDTDTSPHADYRGATWLARLRWSSAYDAVHLQTAP